MIYQDQKIVNSIKKIKCILKLDWYQIP